MTGQSESLTDRLPALPLAALEWTSTTYLPKSPPCARKPVAFRAPCQAPSEASAPTERVAVMIPAARVRTGPGRVDGRWGPRPSSRSPAARLPPRRTQYTRYLLKTSPRTDAARHRAAEVCSASGLSKPKKTDFGS